MNPGREMMGAAEADIVQEEAATFSRMVEQHSGLVFAAVYAVIPHTQDADDLAQETFLRAWENRATLRDQNAAASWLYRIARNVAVAHLRRQSSRPQLVEMDDAFDAVSNSPSPLQAAVDAEMGEVLRTTLELMPDTYRVPLVLSCMEDCTSAQIAELMGVSDDVIRQRLSRGRAILKQEAEERIYNAKKKRRSAKNMAAAVMATILSGGASTTASAAPAAGMGVFVYWGAGVVAVLGIALSLVMCATRASDSAGALAGNISAPAVQPAAKNIVLTVEMIEPDGTPAANAILAITTHQQEIVTHTDDEGIALVTLPLSGVVAVAGCSDVGLGRQFYQSDALLRDPRVSMKLVLKDDFVEPPVPEGAPVARPAESL